MPLPDVHERDKCLKYIQRYWPKVICHQRKDRQLHFGLPHPYISPNHLIFKNDQFYWDSYFTILGLLIAKRKALAKSMADNLIYLFNRFGIIPMRNRYFNLGTSQIPFFSSIALEIFNHFHDRAWLKKALFTAERELLLYWMNRRRTEKHVIHRGLSRYCDHYITHLGAEHESGWDMTSRFNDRCLDYLPVDLNTCLYKYETDLAYGYRLLKNYRKSGLFERRALKRKREINRLMWNAGKKFFFDYNYREKKQSSFYSVAGFYPLWAKLASREQAALMVKNALPLFEYEGGIANTQEGGLSLEVKQHDYPNGWPPSNGLSCRDC